MSRTELEAGEKSAITILAGYENADRGNRQFMIYNVQKMVNEVSGHIHTHKTLTDFGFAFIREVQKRNDPALNEIIKPVLDTLEYRRRKGPSSE